MLLNVPRLEAWISTSPGGSGLFSGVADDPAFRLGTGLAPISSALQSGLEHWIIYTLEDIV